MEQLFYFVYYLSGDRNVYFTVNTSRYEVTWYANNTLGMDGVV